MAQDFARRAGIEVSINMPSAPVRIERDLATALFRVAQESLTNVVKHAEARRASITFAREADGVRLTIADDGKGFDVEARSGGFGLVGMRERVRSFGGQFSIRTDAGGGSVIEVCVPLVTIGREPLTAADTGEVS